VKAANSPGFFLPGLKSYLIVSIGDNTPKQDSSQKHHRKKDAEQAAAKIALEKLKISVF
jgi:dsRNA-specific ribonuclease